jgi:hypothetical protein
VIDRPASEPTMPEQLDPSAFPNASREAQRGGGRQGRSIGGVRITLAVLVVGLAMIGSLAYIGYVVLAVDEEQIPLLAAGFAVLGASFVALAIGTIVGMWRAASRAKGGRALLLAIVGGLAGLAAIGCFTVTALSAMLWNT